MIRPLQCLRFSVHAQLGYNEDLLGGIIYGRTLRWWVHGTFLLSRMNEPCPYRSFEVAYFLPRAWILNYHGLND